MQVLLLIAGALTGSLAIPPALRAWKADGGRPARLLAALPWALGLVALVAGLATGVVACTDDAAPVFALACALPVGLALALARTSASARLGAAGWALRLPVLLACVPCAYVLVEATYSDAPLAVADPCLNLGLLACGLVCAWLLGQRRMGAALAFLACCFVWGLANYFLSIFKGQTVLPSDVLAISTAAEVSSGYAYVLHEAPVASLALLAACASALLTLPSPRPTRLTLPVNLACGLALCAALVNWYQEHDLHQDCGVIVDVWATRDSYMEYGSIPCFLERMQELTPEAPDGYDTQAAALNQERLARSWDQLHPGYDEKAQTADERPTVIAIMNESFSDLSLYEGVKGYEGVTQRLADMGVSVIGSAHTSVSGGGTCNSEFEYLTLASLASMGGGVYPYMHYNLGDAECLPRYFSSLGYLTEAIHPAARTNWRRDVVYEQMGFDTYVSGEEFEDADKLRNLASDRATYDALLDMLAASDEPQFIFDVTLQNHGGYDTGLLDSYEHDDVTVQGQVVEGMSEYLGCIDASLDDLEYLLGELGKLDRKVIVVFFGDHQPGFNDTLSQISTLTSISEMGAEQTQQRFETTWLAWSNYDLDADWASEVPQGMSLGYLGAQTAYLAGLPLTQYQKAVLALQQKMPAVDLSGYQDAAGTWHWIGEESGASAAYGWYEQIQYANLFDAEGNTAFDAFAEEHA